MVPLNSTQVVDRVIRRHSRLNLVCEEVITHDSPRQDGGGRQQTDGQTGLPWAGHALCSPPTTDYLRLRIAGIPRHKKRIHFLWRSCTELYFIIVSNTSGIHLLFGAWSKSINRYRFGVQSRSWTWVKNVGYAPWIWQLHATLCVFWQVNMVLGPTTSLVL